MTTLRRLGPQLAGAPTTGYIAPELQLRVRKLSAALGFVRCAELLKVGQITLIAARDGGRLRPDTIARITEGLDREEAALAARRAG